MFVNIICQELSGEMVMGKLRTEFKEIEPHPKLPPYFKKEVPGID